MKWTPASSLRAWCQVSSFCHLNSCLAKWKHCWRFHLFSSRGEHATVSSSVSHSEHSQVLLLFGDTTGWQRPEYSSGGHPHQVVQWCHSQDWDPNQTAAPESQWAEVLTAQIHILGLFKKGQSFKLLWPRPSHSYIVYCITALKTLELIKLWLACSAALGPAVSTAAPVCDPQPCLRRADLKPHLAHRQPEVYLLKIIILFSSLWIKQEFDLVG